MIYTIVYTSHPHKQPKEHELDDILRTARRNNQFLGVTGVLLLASNTYVQVLEGEEAHVKKIFTSISKDSRHHSINKMFEGLMDARAFKDWSMAYRRMNKKELDGFKKRINLDDPRLFNNIPALTILEAFSALL